MRANYHTHTWRCRHAAGTEREYIETAIAAGVEILGFSDHNPCVFGGEYYSDYRMYPEQTEDYFRTLTDLKQEYAGDIRIHIGLEAEFYPAVFEETMELLSRFPCEYLLLGQHFLRNEYDGPYAYLPSGDPGQLRDYVTQTLEGLSVGMFTYLAHPDLFRWQGRREIYQKEMERLCRGAKQLGVPLEYNLLGLHTGRSYPNPAFWQIAAQTGNDVILGIDAHSPEALARAKTEQRARQALAALGIEPLEEIRLRPICPL